MAKTKETLDLESLLFEYNRFNGFFCIFECTIGFGGGGRVDCIAIDTRSCIRAYELKVTKSDFHSKHGHNFVGNLNYYVMPYKLYEDVKHEIPAGIGVMCPNGSNTSLEIVKKSKKVELKQPLYKMELYIIRSLFREFEKSRVSENKSLLEAYERDKRRLVRERDRYYNMLCSLNTNIHEFLGNKYKNFIKWLHNKNK